jgi:hypothetical protein
VLGARSCGRHDAGNRKAGAHGVGELISHLVPVDPVGDWF